MVIWRMPALGQYRSFLKSVFFLYDSVEDAETGKNSGGTGFIVAVASAVSNRVYCYAVTNWHVACQGSPVIRLTRKDGKPKIFDLGPDQWTFEPGGPDIAYVSIPLDLAEDDARPILLRKDDPPLEEFTPYPIDVGDDVFMIGRFIDYDGAETNTPALRFGNISIMNAEIQQETGYRGPTLVLDMHSRTGFSGSPVFAYRTPGSFFNKKGSGPGVNGDDEVYLGHTMAIIGIHCGQFPEQWELKGAAPKKKETNSLIKTGEYVEGLSGMTTVVPIAELKRMIFGETETAQRAAGDEALRNSPEFQTAPKPEGSPKAEASTVLVPDNPSHKEDFTRLLGAAAKGNKPAS